MLTSLITLFSNFVYPSQTSLNHCQRDFKVVDGKLLTAVLSVLAFVREFTEFLEAFPYLYFRILLWFTRNVFRSYQKLIFDKLTIKEESHSYILPFLIFIILVKRSINLMKSEIW